ncbi:MAG: hypothetical protein IJS74_00905 [Clostridia bacterium]|nr:hypothetical protein [Clostridia bacterium]
MTNLNEYVANGGDLSQFTKEELKTVSQEAIKKYAEKGGNISVFSYEQRREFHNRMIEEEMGMGK